VRLQLSRVNKRQQVRSAPALVFRTLIGRRCCDVGYDKSVQANIGNIFATAAFRFGHSLVPGIINGRDANYNVNREITLSNVTVYFFNSLLFLHFVPTFRHFSKYVCVCMYVCLYTVSQKSSILHLAP